MSRATIHSGWSCCRNGSTMTRADSSPSCPRHCSPRCHCRRKSCGCCCCCPSSMHSTRPCRNDPENCQAQNSSCPTNQHRGSMSGCFRSSHPLSPSSRCLRHPDCSDRCGPTMASTTRMNPTAPRSSSLMRLTCPSCSGWTDHRMSRRCSVRCDCYSDPPCCVPPRFRLRGFRRRRVRLLTRR
jgi:hypothetical protein